MDLSQTPTELALRRRIAQLEAKVELLEREYSLGSFSYAPPEKVELERPDFPPTITLARRAQLSANVALSGGVQVLVRGCSDEGDFGVAYYVDSRQRMRLNEVADLMSQIHLEQIGKLAAFIEKGAL